MEGKGMGTEPEPHSLHKAVSQMQPPRLLMPVFRPGQSSGSTELN